MRRFVLNQSKVHRFITKTCILTLFLMVGIGIKAQTPGGLDLSFNPDSFSIGNNTEANNTIHAIVMQPDGKILIGGEFTAYNGISSNRITRLNPDGSIDTSFDTGTGANNTIYSITLQPDGKILIGGDFTAYNDTAIKHIIRLNPDGSIDTSFNPGTGTNNTVYSIALQSDKKILIGGNFRAYNGVTRNRITRLNADGSLDTSFNIGAGAGNAVYSIAVLPNGKILIGGNFTAYNGLARNRIARLNSDGSIDTGFNTGVGADDVVCSIVLKADGKILIGGYFTTYNNVSRNAIARLNSNGSLDTTFNPGTGANDYIRSIAQQSDEKIIIGGNFTSYNDTTRNHIARLHPNGSLDTTFNPGTGANDIVRSVALQTNGKILITGHFTSYNGKNINRIARLYDKEPAIWTIANTWLNNIVPNTHRDVIINGNLTITDSTSFESSNLTVNGSLTIEDNGSVTVAGKIINNGDFTVNSGGILSQTSAYMGANVGDITLLRYSSPMKRLDYTLWSSPVSGMLLKEFSDVSPSGGAGTLWNRVYTLGETAWNQVWPTQADYLADNSQTFQAAKAYLYRSRNDYHPTETVEFEGEFIGVPHNGNISTSTPYLYNALGNPYPSPIDGNKLLESGANALYFWTNTNAPNENGTYVLNNWASYNGVGGVAASNGTQTPDGIIQNAQGFVMGFSTAIPSRTFTFTNDMRLVAHNGQFFKQMNGERHRFWLNLSAEEITYNQILLGYIEGASNEEDLGVDAHMFGYSGNAIYSLIDESDDKFVIQGRALPFTDTDVVKLGFRAIEAGSFSLALDHFDGDFASEHILIYLKDNFNQTQYNLKEGAYTFVSEVGEFDTRFEVVYQSTLSTGQQNFTASDWIVYRQDNGYQILTINFELKEVLVYDLLGRKVYSSTAEGTTHQVPSLGANGIFIVKIISPQGQVLSKKVK